MENNMINKKVWFSAPKQGYMGDGSYKGTIVDKVIVPKKVYEHKPTVMHNSYNPEYKETVEANAYLIEDDETGHMHTVFPEKIISFVK